MAAGCGLSAAFKLKGHQAAILSSASLGSLLASGDEDGRLLIHDLRRAATSAAAAAPSAGAGASAGDAPAPAAPSANGKGSTTTASPASPAAADGSRPLLSLTLKGVDRQPAPVTAIAVIPCSSSSSTAAADGGGSSGLFAAAGSLVHQVDVRAPGSVVRTYDGAREEVNGLAVNCRGSYLAAGDDGGEVQVYDMVAGKQYKGVRNVHRSICSSVAFRPHKPWDLLSGGLDSTVAKYDFSRPKCIDRWDMAALAAQPGAAGGGGGGGQIFNPPFVHQVAVPAGEARPGCGWLAAARGDGAVVVLDADVSSAASGSSGPTSVLAAAAAGGRKGSGAGGGGGGGGASKGKGKGGSGGGLMLPLVLDRDVGGHTLPVCSVAWSPAAAAAAGPAELSEAAASWTCRLYSGGEDCRVVVWDIGGALGARASGRPLVPPPWQPRPPAPAPEGGGSEGSSSAAGSGGAEKQGPSGPDGTGEEAGQEEGAVAVLAEVSHGRKVNQLCALGLDGKEFVAVAAVSKFLVLYELSIGCQ